LQGFWFFFSQAFASFLQLDQLVDTKVFIFGKLLPNFATNQGPMTSSHEFFFEKIGCFAKKLICIMSNIE
jgi:hypothetical protein